MVIERNKKFGTIEGNTLIMTKAQRDNYDKMCESNDYSDPFFRKIHGWTGKIKKI